MQVVKLVSFGAVFGVPIAVTGFELIGGPAAVTGSSMQVSITVNIHRKMQIMLLFYKY